MNDTPKRFEDWDKVDCNECAKYWDSSCDGVSKGSQRPCNSFLATREIVIPAKLKKLERRVEWLEWAVGIMIALIAIVSWVVYMIG